MVARWKLAVCCAALTALVGGCSYVDSDWNRLAGWMPKMSGGSASAAPSPVQTTARVRNRPAPGGPGPLAGRPTDAGWIVDPVLKCGTSNPYPKVNETIRWFGACENGRLTGRGTLVWYEDGVESERNEGAFRAGELHGEAITTYPDGQVVVGRYDNGVRDGEFVVVRAAGAHLRAAYDRGDLKGETPMSTAQIDAWRRERTAAAGGVLAQAAMEAPQAAATTRAANERLVAANPAAPPQGPTPVADRRREGAQPVLQLASAPDPRGGALAAPAPAPVDSRTERTSHVGASLGGAPRLAALAPTISEARPPLGAAGPASAERPALTLTSAPSPAVPPANSVTEMASRFAGRDGPWVVAMGAPAIPAGPQLAAPRVAPPVRLNEPKVESRQLAGYFAGRDGPWVVGAARPAVATVTPLAGPAISAPVMAQAAPLRPAGLPLRAEAAAGTAGARGDANPDALFQQSYQWEFAGRYLDAEQGYQRIVADFPTAPVAPLARARLGALRGGPAQVAAATVTPREAGDSPSGIVVAVNSPRPAAPAAIGQGTAGNPSLSLQSPLINRLVCSQEGIYQEGARWCGLVTFDEGDFLQVEVRDIRLGGFGQVGISRSACSGNTFLTWFSRGVSVRVPKRCMSLVG